MYAVLASKGGHKCTERRYRSFVGKIIIYILYILTIKLAETIFWSTI